MSSASLTRAEHPVGDREQQRAQGLGRFVVIAHPRAPLAGTCEGSPSVSPYRKPSRQLVQAGRQSSSRFAFSLDAPRPSVIHRTTTSPAASRASHAGSRHRRLRAHRRGEVGQPLRHRRRIVVDDVVDARLAPLHGRDRSGGGVVEVDERPHPGAAADDRHLAGADQLDHRLRRSRPVEAAVAQHDPGQRRLHHRLLQVLDGGHGLPLRLRGLGVERVVLGLHRPTGAAVGPACVALRDDLLDAARLGRGQQVPGPGRPQLVGRGEPAVEPPQVRRSGQRGHLVNDHVRLRLGDRSPDRDAVQPVHDDGTGAERLQLACLGRAPGRRGHLVPARHQLRQQPPTQRSGSACNEDSHHTLLPLDSCVAP